MRILFAGAPRRLFADGAGILAALAFAMLASACSDSPTESTMGRLWPGGALTGTGFQLEGIEVTACQYGGEYPNCKSAPIDDGYDPNLPPSGGSTGTTTGGDGGGGGSTTGTTTPPPDSTATCDPAIHPDCEKPLTTTDTATINKALRQMMRPASQFTDTLALKDCRQMEAWFRDALAAGDVFRGSFDSDTTNDANGEHYGLFDGATSHIHFDPSGLDGANSGNQTDLREVAITALHEGSHWGGKQHPAGPTFDSQGRDYYTDSPFNRLNPGPNSCIPR